MVAHVMLQQNNHEQKETASIGFSIARCDFELMYEAHS